MVISTWIATALEKRRPLLIAFAAIGHRVMDARHLRGIRRRSAAVSAERDVSRESWRKALLLCGILSSLLYGAMIGTILAYGSLGPLGPFAPMHRREVLAAGGGTLGDTMHVVLGGVTVLLMFLTIGFGAAALGNRFRLYSFVSSVVLVAFGAMTLVEAPRLEAGLPTPWIGLWERINISVFLLWIAVLATVLLRAPKRPAAPTGYGVGV